jgi:hypothetical protein
MLFDDRLLFVHVPKTAGIAITNFLIHNIPGSMTLTEPSDAPDPSIKLPARVRAKLKLKRFLTVSRLWYPRRVRVVHGKRHERLFEARETLARFQRSLDDFHAILAVVRNPYDLEVSRYHFLRLGYHGVTGLARGREQRFAMAQDFEQFALSAPFGGRRGVCIEQWYEIDGRMPDNLRLLRFETLEDELLRAFGEIYPIATRLCRENASSHGPWRTYLTPASEEAIYRKYQWLFDKRYYAREQQQSR